MKRYLIPCYLVLALFTAEAFAQRGTVAPTAGKAVRRDSSATNIPATYTTGAAIITSLSGKSHFTCCTTIATDLFIATSTATNCAGASDNYYLPAAPGGSVSCITKDYTFINTNLCARSTGSAISSGILGCDAW